MKVEALFDKTTFTLTYVVYDEVSKDAIVIDPVLDYDPAASRIAHDAMNRLVQLISEKKLYVHYLLETHAHADHVTASHLLKKKFFPQVKIGIGRRITVVQESFKKIFNLGPEFHTDGRQFDCLFNDNQTVTAGTLEFRVLFTPGHTPACCSYLIGDAVFTGDALFMPDYGTGRCDFPAGSARDLWRSITQRLYTLPDSTRVFVGHDYQPNGRELKWQSTIGEEKRSNIQLSQDTSEEEYVAFRSKRDATLSAPRLLLPSIQLNIAAGELPPSESNGMSYLKIPLWLAED